jgi:hypothetical protein
VATGTSAARRLEKSCSIDSDCMRAGGWKRDNSIAKTAAVKELTDGKEAVVTVISGTAGVGGLQLEMSQ